MRIGYACAYTPLPLIDAAGCEPFRILPLTEAPDQAGLVIHDNMCPHVKRILDRAMGEDLPELDGVVMVNSCDAMRRLADAWRQVRPGDPFLLIDLPPSEDPRSIRWLRSELERLRNWLSELVGHPVTDEDLDAAMARYHGLADLLVEARSRLSKGTLAGGSPALQRAYNEVSAGSLAKGLDAARRLLAEKPGEPAGGLPIHLFGNVVADPDVFSMIEECGARVVSDDLCTGSRLVQPFPDPAPGSTPLEALAAGLLARQACARTFRPGSPGQLAVDVVEGARRSGAAAVVAYVMKFCDPYLGRMPAVREACAAARLPLLILEGDCTLRSLGQQTTRIEAFVEMLEGTV
ncbi:MAG: 2-hydroxyacyl-CoA dehydratase family protein [Pseudomonadota bacterium]